MLARHPEIPARIVTAVQERREQARKLLQSLPLAKHGVETTRRVYAGLYELLYVGELCARAGRSPRALASDLLGHVGVRVLPAEQFFLPEPGPSPTRPFLRLSFGRVGDIEAGIAALWEGLRAAIPEENPNSTPGPSCACSR